MGIIRSHRELTGSATLTSCKGRDQRGKTQKSPCLQALRKQPAQRPSSRGVLLVFLLSISCLPICLGVIPQSSSWDAARVSSRAPVFSAGTTLWSQTSTARITIHTVPCAGVAPKKETRARHWRRRDTISSIAAHRTRKNPRCCCANPQWRPVLLLQALEKPSSSASAWSSRLVCAAETTLSQPRSTVNSMIRSVLFARVSRKIKSRARRWRERNLISSTAVHPTSRMRRVLQPKSQMSTP